MRKYDHTDRALLSDNHPLFPSYHSRSMWHCLTQVGHVKAARGWGISQRSHGFLLQYVRSGKGWVRTHNHQFDAKQGDLIFLDCHAHYELAADPSVPWEFYWAVFESPIAHHWIEEMECDTNPILHPRNPRRIQAHFERLGRLADRKPPGHEAQLSAVTYQIVTELYAEQARQKATAFDTAESKDYENPYVGAPRPVRRVLDLIHRNHRGPLQFWQMVRDSGVSRSHLFTLFKKHLRMSPMEYLCVFRIHHARELLQHTNLLIKEVSLEVGIEDVHYFSRLFRKKTGDTPKKYRAKSLKYVKSVLRKI